MKQRILRILRALTACGILLVILLVFATPVLAIDNPSTMQINAVWAYRNVKETGDQLYLIDYTLTYDTNPDTNITQTYLVRLMNGTTELSAVAPYAYYNDGYDRGLVAIYFSAASAPAWAGDYTIRFEGNPTLEWESRPVVTYSVFDLWQDNPTTMQQSLISSRILWMAEQLESAWSVDMIESSATGNVLTSYGVACFSSVISDLHTIAPYAFSGQIIAPDFSTTAVVDPSYAESLTTPIISSPLDLTETANAFGLSRGFLTAILYYGLATLAIVLIARRLNTYKPVMLLFIPVCIGAPFVGVPLIVTIIVGFAALILIGFALFYRPSGA